MAGEYSNKTVLTDSGSNPVPQYWQSKTSTPQVVTGDKAPYQQIMNSDGNPVSQTSPLPVQQTSTVTDFTFQDIATQAQDGNVFDVGTYKILTIEIRGILDSSNVAFEGSSLSGAWYPLAGTNMSTFLPSTSTTGNEEIWQFDITGLTQVRFRIVSINGGNLTIKGMAVA